MATTALTLQNWFETTLSSSINATDTTVSLNAVPTGVEGFLIIEPDSTTAREVIYYTSKGASSVTLPSVGAGRGQDGTTASSHASGSTVRMNITKGYWAALQDGTAISSASITPNKLNLAPVEGYVATSETCISTTYADCATVTDTATVTIGANGLALVTIGCRVSSDTADSFNYMGFVVSGANTITAGTSGREIVMQTSGANRAYKISETYLITGLAAGSTTFKLKYKVANGGGGTGTATFLNRRIAVIPL